jgi:hypothetical protein
VIASIPGCGTERTGRRGCFVFFHPLRHPPTPPRAADDDPDRSIEQEIKIATGILVKTPLVVKRIADKETKQPRLPVTAELLQKEVRAKTGFIFSPLSRSPPARVFVRARSFTPVRRARAAACK